MRSPLDALGPALRDLAAAHPDLVVLTGREGPEVPGAHRLVVAGPAARLAAGDGLALTGRRVVTVGNDLPDATWLIRPQVLVVGPVGRVTGLRMVVPVWPGDVAELLQAAVAAARPLELRLHAAALGPPPTAELTPTPWDAPLVLRAGGPVLLAAGSAVPLAAAVADLAADRGAHLGAVALRLVPPALAAELARALLLVSVAEVDRLRDGGPPDPDAPRIAVVGRSPAAVLEHVLAALATAP